MTKSTSTANDTSTQAMTEVALGLSMAFFALLILALLSMSAESALQSAKTGVSLNEDKSVHEKAMPEGERLRLSAQQEQTDQAQRSSQDANALSEMQFVFHYANQYFDANLQPLSLDSITISDSLVVAVLPQMSFTEVMSVHADFAPQQIQITAMDKNWQDAFEQLNNAQ